MPKQLTALFIPLNAVGHINSSIGIAEILQSRGHRIIFAVNKIYKGKFIERGFEEEIIEKESETEFSFDQMAKMFKEYGMTEDCSPIEKLNEMAKLPSGGLTKYEDQNIKEIIQRTKPDVILNDFVFAPSIINSTIPWVNVLSVQVLTGIDDERTPPWWLGLPTYENSQWKEQKDIIKHNATQIKKGFYSLLEEEGLKPFPDDRFIESPYLNIYAYPMELDYLDQRPLPPKWHRFDSFVRLNEKDFELPEKLKEKSGKLIFLSMGTLGSMSVELMKRLVNLVGDLPFRFIIAKGVLGDQYDLPDNCWGENMVSQMNVLPKVDLVITHGGNNTVGETFYFGKPMIVMPMFCHQFDNAQRIQEKGFGIRMNPFQCTKDQLLNAIEKLINDEELALRMKKISERIKAEVKLGKVGQLIENLIESADS